MLRAVQKNKEKLITVRFTPQEREDFKIAAGIEGGSASSLIRMFVIRKIRDAKERYPEAFTKRGQSDSTRPVITARIKKQKDKGKGKQNRG